MSRSSDLSSGRRSLEADTYATSADLVSINAALTDVSYSRSTAIKPAETTIASNLVIGGTLIAGGNIINAEEVRAGSMLADEYYFSTIGGQTPTVSLTSHLDLKANKNGSVSETFTAKKVYIQSASDDNADRIELTKGLLVNGLDRVLKLRDGYAEDLTDTQPVYANLAVKDLYFDNSGTKLTGQLAGKANLEADASGLSAVFAGDIEINADLTITGDILGPGSGLNANSLNIKTARAVDTITLQPNNTTVLTASDTQVSVNADLEVVGDIGAPSTAAELVVVCRAARRINFRHDGPTDSTQAAKLGFNDCAAALGANGKWYFNTQLRHYGGLFNGSDDRLKINETPIIDALETIRKLSPQRYTRVAKEEHTTGWEEAGFIAQSVDKIPELQFTVQTDDENPDPITGETPTGYLALDYNSIFTHLVAAVKELDTIVQQQAARIEILENGV